MRRASLLTLLLAASCAAKSKTQYEDKPPGWRPDKPTETAIEIVDRLLRKLKRYGDYPSGPWFYLFQESYVSMEKALKYLQPATLKSEGDRTEIDDEGRAIMVANEKALRWQAEQVDLLSGVSRDDDVAHWPIAECDRLIRKGKLLHEPYFDKLSAKQRRSLAKDFAAVLRVFEYTFASMPDDEEAAEISHQNNLRDGYPPPSQPPPVPGSPPPPTKKRRKAKVQKGHEEL